MMLGSSISRQMFFPHLRPQLPQQNAHLPDQSSLPQEHAQLIYHLDKVAFLADQSVTQDRPDRVPLDKLPD